MKTLSIFEKFVDLIFKIADYFCRIALLFMTIMVVLQVVFRAFMLNIAWCEEVILVLLVYLTFLTMTIGIKEDLHIRIEFFAAIFPKAVRKAINLFNDLLLLFANAMMAFYGFKLVSLTSNTKLAVTRWPKSITYVMIGVAGVMAVLLLAGRLAGMFKTKATEDFIDGVKEE